MSALILSPHAESRMRQRGFRHCDLDLYFLYASEAGCDAYFLGRRDAQREIRHRQREIRRLKQPAGGADSKHVSHEIRRLKHEIQALQRLRGLKLVVANDNTVVTCYRPNRGNRKRTLRRGREFR